MRASVLVLGPLVARYGRARVSLPGGCAIGARPIDQHLKGLEAMGAKITLEHGYVDVECKRLRGATIVLDMPTVTGTENLMMAAALAKGRTRDRERRARARGRGARARAQQDGRADPGRRHRRSSRSRASTSCTPIEHAIIPDRIEAGTFTVAAAMTRGDVLLEGARPEHLDAVIAKLRAAGVTRRGRGGRPARARHAASSARSTSTTQPHPGFPTDMQAQFMVLACLAEGPVA